MHTSVSSFPVKKKKFERAENIPFKPENWSNNLFSFRNSIHKIIIIIDFFPFPRRFSWIPFLENDPQCFDSAVNQFEIIARAQTNLS